MSAEATPGEGAVPHTEPPPLLNVCPLCDKLIKAATSTINTLSGPAHEKCAKPAMRRSLLRMRRVLKEQKKW